MSKLIYKSRPPKSILDFSSEKLLLSIKNSLKKKKIISAYIFGSFAQKKSSEWSDLDMVIIVEKTKKSFLERPIEFTNLLNLDIPIDILVYTKKEFESFDFNSGFWKEFKENNIKVI